MKTDMLVKTIKEIISKTHEIGLKVVATVCDQGGPNRAAIKELLKQTQNKYHQGNIENRNFGFEINGEEVVPLFDPPHLLKCMRNNFFQYKVSYNWRFKKQVAMWDHIRQLYVIEDDDIDYKLCHKLTEAHIYNTKKMKVSVATQVLSSRVAAAMKNLATHGSALPMEAIHTAEFILFMDKVFDSVNGASIRPEGGKFLRTAVTQKSDHTTFWTDAIKVFESIQFHDIKNPPPTIYNWIHTLKGFKYLWSKLHANGFKFLCPRNFNQDPIENFFGSIRSHGVRNINPNCNSFINSFKTLIINNYVTPHSLSANCENDESAALSDLKEFLKYETYVEQPLKEIMPIEIPSKNLTISCISQGVLTYIAGFVAKKLLKKIKTCKQCKLDLIGMKENLSEQETNFIEARAYSHNALLFPN